MCDLTPSKEGEELLKSLSYRVAHHGVGLPWPGLPVGEDAGVVALKRSLEDNRAQVFEDLR